MCSPVLKIYIVDNISKIIQDDTRITANEQYECRYDNQELYIKYLLDENSGRYTCRVENRFGKDENYQIISIKGINRSVNLIITTVTVYSL